MWIDISLEWMDPIEIRMAEYASDLPDRDLMAEGFF